MPQVSILLFLSSLTALLIVWRFRKTLRQRRAHALTLMQLAVAWWCFWYGVETLTTDPALAVVWAILEYAAIASLPVFWYLFALEYTQEGNHVASFWRALIWVLPAFIMIAVITNPLHHLFWTEVTFRAEATIPVVFFGHGALFWLHSLYSYFLMTMGMMVFILSGFRYPSYYRRQVAIIVLAALIPWLANLVYVFDLSPLPGVDLTPISFVVTVILLIYGITRAGLLNLTPIAEDLLFRGIPYGVIILDEQDRLINLNPAALKLLNLPDFSQIGKPISQLIPKWPEIVEQLGERRDMQREIILSESNLHLEMQLSALFDVGHQLIGWVLVLRDVSQKFRMETEMNRQTELLTHIVNHLPAVLMYVSIDSRLLFYNRAFAEWLGKPDKDMIGNMVQDILPERIYRRLAHYYQLAVAGERVAVDTLLEDKAGKPLYLHIDLVPHQDENGEMKAVLALVQDITERHRTEQSEQKQRAWAEALRQTVAALNSTLEYEEVLDIILDRIAVVLPHDAANIGLIDSQDNIRIQRARGYGQYARQDGDPLPTFKISVYANMRRMIETASPFAIPDTHKDPDWRIAPEFSWVRSYAGAPICISDRVIGILSLDSATPGFFKQDHAELLMAFANEAAVAIEKARLYVDVRRRAEELASINRIAMAITAGLDLERVLAAILEQCQQVLPLDVFYIALYDEEKDLVELPLFFDLGQVRKMPARQINEKTSLTGYIMKNRQTLYIADVLDPDYPSPVSIMHLGGISSRCYLGVPLVLRDRVIGAISIQTYYADAYTQDQIRLLEVIATQAAIALENARLYAQAQSMAITDSLTGLYNRRFLLERAEHLISEAEQSQEALSIILLDGDWFKQINDTYGHLVGDQALITLARACKEVLRPVDIVGRYGGEEYCILMPGMALDEARQIAEGIRSTLSLHTMTADKKTFAITASFGVAEYINGEGLTQALSRADAALYRAKANGRNRVEQATR